MSRYHCDVESIGTLRAGGFQIVRVMMRGHLRRQGEIRNLLWMEKKHIEYIASTLKEKHDDFLYHNSVPAVG